MKHQGSYTFTLVKHIFRLSQVFAFLRQQKFTLLRNDLTPTYLLHLIRSVYFLQRRCACLKWRIFLVKQIQRVEYI